MNCSPLQIQRQTTLPRPLREWVGRRLRGPARGPQSRRQRHCIFALGRIGDYVLTLGAQRALVTRLGAADCVLVVPAGSASLAAREFPDVRQIVLPTDAASLARGILPAWWRERPKFAGDRFERLICLSHQRGLYYELALSWIAADRDFRLLPATYPQEPADGWCTELLAHWRLVELALGHPVSREEILPAFTSQPVGADGRLLVYPLASEAFRTLPVAATVEILRLWRQRCPAPIVFGGSPADGPALVPYVQAAQALGLDRLHVELAPGVDGLLDHIARGSALFAADSGPAHIAIALDKPVTIVTGLRLYGYCQPWARSARQQLFLDDTPAEVVAAALPVLGGSGL